MLDETRTICGRNGRNSDFVQNDKVVNPLKIRICSQRISSTNVMRHYFVHQYDGVPFGSNCFSEIATLANGDSYEKE